MKLQPIIKYLQQNQTKTVLFVALVLTLAVISMTQPIVTTRKLASQPVAVNPVKMYFSPPLSFIKTTPQTVALMLDTGGASVGHVSVRLGFDPKTVTNVSVKPENVSNTGTSPFRLTGGLVDRGSGTIYYALTALPVPPAPPGAHPQPVKIASITFTIAQNPQPGENLFTFQPSTSVYPLQTSGSVAAFGGTTQTTRQKSLLQSVAPLKAGGK